MILGSSGNITKRAAFWEGDIRMVENRTAVLLGRKKKKWHWGQAPIEARALIDGGNLDALEDMWMSRMESDPTDLEFFLPVFAALVRKDEKKRAEVLVQLLFDSFPEDQKNTYDELLIGLLVLWPDFKRARDRVIERLREFHGAGEELNVVLREVNAAKSDNPLSALEAAEQLLSYSVGTGVNMQVKGVGRIVETNLGLKKIKVSFGKELMSFRFDEAGRLLEILPPGHFLLQKLEDPESLKKLSKDDPGEALSRLFTSVKRPLGSTEVKEMFSGIIMPNRWSTWWNKAKQDPRLTVSAGSRPTCTWNETADAADDTVLEEFRKGDLNAKIDLARKQGSRSTRVAGAMADELLKLIEPVKEKSPASVMDILLTIEKLSLDDSKKVREEISSMIQRPDINVIIERMGNKATRRKAAALIREHRDDWENLYLDLLGRESDTQMMSFLYDSLHERDSEKFVRLVRTTLNNPTELPHFYVWLCRELPQRDELKKLADWGFMQAMIGALSETSMKEHHAILKKQFDQGGAFSVGLGSLEANDANALLTALDRDSTLEDYRRQWIREDTLARFPDLNKKEETTFFVSAEALEAKKEEFMKLIKVDIPHNTEELRRAKSFGDLKENFEYHAARSRQEFLSSRAKTLQDQLEQARIIEPSTVDTSCVSIGTRVILQSRGGDGTNQTLTILGPWDSNPNEGILSYTAPAANGLLRGKPGQTVEYNGDQYVIGSIELWKQS